MRRAILLVAVMIAAVLVAASAAYANHWWGRYHWARTSNPFSLQLNSNLNSTWRPYLDAASSSSNNDWSDSSVLDTKVADGGKDPNTCSPTSGEVEVCNAAYGKTGWLGVAQIWASGKHILQGATKLNDTYFDTTKYNTSAWRQMVMCQEVGHTFGLDHQDENFSNTNLGTCMDYTNDPSGTAGTNGTLPNTFPNQHDYDELNTIYEKLDSWNSYGTNAASKMPAQAKQGNFNSRAAWGQLIRTSQDGKLKLYQRDFGGGYRLFTFVIEA